MYYEILIYEVILVHFSFTLPLIRQCFFLFLFFPVSFFTFFLKPKQFCQYLFENLQKQQLRVILLNIYVFNLINFTKLFSLLATFFNTLVSKLLLILYDVASLNNVKSTFFISMLILTTLYNVKTMLLFSTSSFITLINVETTL